GKPDALHSLADDLHSGAFEVSAWRRIDRDDLGREPAIARGAGHEAGRVTGTNFYDSGGVRLANEDVGRGRVETGEPVLVPARLRRRAVDRLERSVVRRHRLQKRRESIGSLPEDWLKRLVSCTVFPS